MTKELITTDFKYDMKNHYALSYADKHPEKIAKFCKAYASGRNLKSVACKVAGLSIRTLQIMQKIANDALEYCEENNINYKDTIFKSLIDTSFVIEQARQTASEKLVNNIHKQADDGNFNAAKYLLGKIDAEWCEASNNQINVNIDTNSNSKGVQIDLFDFDSIVDIVALEQEDLINKTRDK